MKTISALFFAAGCFLAQGASAQATSQQAGNFHLQIYQDAFGNPLDIELFTKSADKNQFFGITCSAMSPLPMLQVLLFDDDILSETPKFLEATVRTDGATYAMNAILQPTLNADEVSNKLRLEFAKTAQTSNFTQMERQYSQLLKTLMQEKPVAIEVTHRTFGNKVFQFETEGLATLLKPRFSLCSK